ncbi:MAG: PEP-CTERM sorting domain-containing protein [Planctomycetota bacterium]
MTALAAIYALPLVNTAYGELVVYREVFPRDVSVGTDEEQLASEGWSGGHSGDAFGVTPAGGEGAIGGGGFGPESTPINSNPQGPLSPPTSFAFFSETVTSNAYLYTTEIELPSSSLAAVTWDSRNSFNVEDNAPAGSGWFDQGTVMGGDTHIAVRIDDGVSNVWYVSAEGFLHQGGNVWLSNEVAIEPLNWVVFNNGPTDGSTLPGVSAGFVTVPDLPAGTIDAIGFYWGRNVDTNRIDNFALVVPEPASALLCLMGVAALARRRR